jgi:hypothetical protein
VREGESVLKAKTGLKSFGKIFFDYLCRIS